MLMINLAKLIIFRYNELGYQKDVIKNISARTVKQLTRARLIERFGGWSRGMILPERWTKTTSDCKTNPFGILFLITSHNIY